MCGRKTSESIVFSKKKVIVIFQTSFSGSNKWGCEGISVDYNLQQVWDVEISVSHAKYIA